MNNNYLGYLDNETTNFVKYERRLKRKGLNLLCKNGKPTKEEVVTWLVENNIKCFMVDYKLEPQFDYQGTDLLFYIKGILPDLPCIILTNYKSDSLIDNLVEEFAVFDRKILSDTGDSFDQFVETLRRTIKVFDKRMEIRVSEYESLYLKKKSEGLTSLENENFMKNYTLLRSYGIVDDIPSEFLNSRIEESLDHLLKEIEEVLKDDRKN